MTTCKLLLQDVDDFEFFFSCVVKSKKDWLHFIVKKKRNKFCSLLKKKQISHFVLKIQNSFASNQKDNNF